MTGLRVFLYTVLTLGVLSLVARAEPYRPLDHLWQGTRDLPDTQNVWVLGAGTALTVGALALDHRVHDYFSGHDRMGPAARIGNDYLGTGVPGAVLGAATLGFGLWKGRQHEIDAGEAQLEALAAAAIYTEVLKLAVRRQRPDGGSHNSFPSGHTSTTFTSASALLDLYGWQVGAPAFALAAFTGVCRLDVSAHHLSDVVFGATLGLLVGHGYAIHHTSGKGGTSEARLVPYFDGRSDYGLNLEITFPPGSPGRSSEASRR